MKKLILLTAVVAALCSCGESKYDVCVYGGTASGIVAANAAAKMGLKVVVIEPTNRIGGMTTGGLGRTDIGNKQVVKGLALKFYRELGKRYGNLENWVFEPSAAFEVMKTFADVPNVSIVKGRYICSASVNNGRIESLSATDGTDTLEYRAEWFIDCSYEGDLMAKAGVSYRTGREDNSEYCETWDGSQCLEGHQFPDGVDPFVVPGDPKSGLLWGISKQEMKENGKGDNYIQAYNYRICLTDVKENMIPIGRPDDYDSTRYELLLRLYDAQKDKRGINDYFIWSLMPNHKTDINNRGGFSTDMIGMNYNYPEGTWEERQAILDAHKSYTLGLLYFVGNDPRVPAELRDEVAKWGFPKDEYMENGNWTPQLYVRECRRLVGEYVATQADCENRTEVGDGVAYAAYNMDSHNCERVVLFKNGKYMVKNEGNVEIPGGVPYPISYRSVTPRREECTNLLVPVCCSASHIAYGSIRMEPVFMCLGQAAGIAVGLARKNGLKTLQEVDSKQINGIFAMDPYMDGTTPDIILDDPDASVEGDWFFAKSNRGYGASFYKCKGKGSVTFKLTAPFSGTFKVYNYTHFANFEGTKLNIKINPITKIEFPDGSVHSLDASNIDLSSLGQTTTAWEEIGEVTLEKGKEYRFRTIGEEMVVADALLLIKE